MWHRLTVYTTCALQVVCGSSGGVVCLCDISKANGDGVQVVQRRFNDFESLTSVHVNATDQFILASGSGTHNSVCMYVPCVQACPTRTCAQRFDAARG